MNAVQQLASTIANAVKKANSTVGMAEQAVVSGGSVVTSHGIYSYTLCCPIDIYDGKTVWIQITDSGDAVIIGD